MPKETKTPHQKMMDDLEKLVKKHGNIADKVTIASVQNKCPKGTTPQEITIQKPDGSTETRVICV